MKTIKHLFTALLLLCATVVTAHDFVVGGIYYDITEWNYSVEVVSGDNKYTGAVVIPETVTYEDVTYWVTSIGGWAFYGCSGLASIEIPNSVTSIGGYAFFGCKGLASVEIPNSVTSIGERAFYSCEGLTSVEIPNSVTSIGFEAFDCCHGLTSIEIPNSVTSIGGGAFYGCSGLTSIEIPNSVTSIGDNAFEQCSGLTSIEIPNSVTSIGERAFRFCSSLESITVAADNSVYDSREGCNAIIETASNTLVAGCKNTVIPNGVTSIGSSAFHGCSGLTNIEIPNSVTSIGDYAFDCCQGLTSIEIPNSVTSIGDDAFGYCSGLESITVAADNSVYDSREGCNAIIETASNTLVAGCKNTVIPNSVTSIGDYAFDCCQGLTSIEIPNSVTSIGDYAFSNCSGLTSIEIPNSVTSIGGGAFWACRGLASIISHIPAGKLFSPNSSAFSNVDKTNCTLYVPYGAKGKYAATDGWREFKNIVELPDDAFDLTVTSAGYASLYLASAVEIPLGVEVYTATAVEGDLLKMQQVTGILPANTGAIVKADAGTYSFNYSDENPAAIEGNLLLGTTTSTYIKPTAGTAAYVLSQVDGIVGMYLAELNGEGRFLNNANKAYMLLGEIKIEDGEIDTSAPGTQLSAGYRFDFGGTTGVEKVEMRKEKGEIYDLQGRKVEHPTKGMYIIDGRVMLVE